MAGRGVAWREVAWMGRLGREVGAWGAHTPAAAAPLPLQFDARADYQIVRG